MVAVLHLYSLEQCPEFNFGTSKNSLKCTFSRVFGPPMRAPYQQQQVHFPSALLKSLSCLMMAVPRIAVGHLLVAPEFHLNLIIEVNLTLENSVFNLLPLFHEVSIVGLSCNPLLNLILLSRETGHFLIELLSGCPYSFCMPCRNC